MGFSWDAQPFKLLLAILRPCGSTWLPRSACDTFGLTGRVQTGGGSGNPSETGGQYGWNIEIIEQSPTWAQLRIWNSQP